MPGPWIRGFLPLLLAALIAACSGDVPSSIPTPDNALDGRIPGVQLILVSGGGQVGVPAADQPTDQGDQGVEVLFAMTSRSWVIQLHEPLLDGTIAASRVVHGCSSELGTVVSTEERSRADTVHVIAHMFCTVANATEGNRLLIAWEV